MPEELDWVYYDWLASGATASAVKTLFAQSEGTSNHYTTNMPVKSRLLDTEEFEIKEISAWFETDLNHASLIKLYDRCVLELKINNDRILVLPMIMCAPRNKFIPCNIKIGEDADTQVVGAAGGPFKLRIPIRIPAGASFSVEVTIGHGGTPTTTHIGIALRGILRRR